MRAVFGGLAALLLGAAGSHAMAASIIENGSFERGIDPGSFVTVPGGDTTSIAGWTVGGDSVDYIGSYWQPQNGARSIDMSGNGPGTLSQSFATVAGQNYVVSFWIAGNPDGPPPTKMIDAEVSSNLISFIADPVYTFTVGGHTRDNMGWVQESFGFTGTGSDTLTFTELGGTAYGTALDNVSVSAVPLPASAPMFGAALVVLGTIGYGLKRRASAAAA